MSSEKILGRLAYKIICERTMAKKLYVGGLPYATTENALREYFSQAGNVESAMIISDKMTGRSKGFGFVEMSTDDEAQKAIEMFNGKDFEGRSLVVNEARPMEARPPRSGGFGGSGGSLPPLQQPQPRRIRRPRWRTLVITRTNKNPSRGFLLSTGNVFDMVVYSFQFMKHFILI